MLSKIILKKHIIAHWKVYNYGGIPNVKCIHMLVIKRVMTIYILNLKLHSSLSIIPLIFENDLSFTPDRGFVNISAMLSLVEI